MDMDEHMTAFHFYDWQGTFRISVIKKSETKYEIL